MSAQLTWRVGLAVVFFVGLAHGLWWMQHKAERWYEGQDSHEYHILAINLVNGRGYSRDAEPPYKPAMHREPGYAAFVAAVFKLTGNSDDAVAVVQSMLVGISGVLAALLAFGVFRDRRIGLLAGLWTSLIPDLGDHARYQMSEILFTPLLLLAALTTFHAWKRASATRSALAGLAFGAAGYVRVMAFPAAALLAVGTAIIDRRRLNWRWVAVFLGVMVLAATPWVVRNTLALQQTGFTGRGGGFVMPRGDKAAAPLEKQLTYAGMALWVVAYPFSELVVPFSQLHREPYVWDGPLGDYALLDTTRAFGKYCNGTTGIISTDECFTQVGLQLILTHPLQYVLLTPVEFVRLTFYTYPSKLMVIRNWTIWVGIISLLVSVLSRRVRTPERLWLALVILSYTLPSIVGDAQDRYGVPLVPFYAIFAAAGVAAVARRLYVQLRPQPAIVGERKSTA